MIEQKANSSERRIEEGRKLITEILNNDLGECVEDRNTEEELYSVLDGLRAAFDVAALGSAVRTTEATGVPTNDLNVTPSNTQGNTDVSDTSHIYVIMITEALYAIGGIGIGLRRWWMQKNRGEDYESGKSDIDRCINIIMERLSVEEVPEKEMKVYTQELQEAKELHHIYKQRLLKNLRSFMMYRMLSVTMSLVTIALLSVSLSERETDNTVGFILTGINLAFSRAVSQLTNTRLQKLVIGVEKRAAERLENARAVSQLTNRWKRNGPPGGMRDRQEEALEEVEMLIRPTSPSQSRST